MQLLGLRRDIVDLLDAADGDPERSEEEVAHWSRQFLDAFTSDPEALEARRPIYIDYLLRHSE